MHTYALLEVSKEAYAEISATLKSAGYDHAFGSHGEIDMHGLAIISKLPPPASTPEDAWDRAMDIIR